MDDRTEQDRALVRATLRGEDEAYGELIERYQRMVAGVAWRYGAAADDVDDLVSEVFMKAYTQLKRYRPSHAFSTWLYRLAANHVIDYGRRRKHEQDRREMPQEVVSDASTPEQTSMLTQRQQQLRDAMNELPTHYREAMFLVYVEGHSIDESARLLGLPTGTIKTRLMRGRNALRETMATRFPSYFADAMEEGA